ncbi:unnamed protein product [Sphagnum tenellum]
MDWITVWGGREGGYRKDCGAAAASSSSLLDNVQKILGDCRVAPVRNSEAGELTRRNHLLLREQQSRTDQISQ